MANSVRNLGPLWSQSAFGFETNNGVLVHSRRAKNHYLQQISWKYCTKVALISSQKKDSVDENNKINVCGKKTEIQIEPYEKKIYEDFGFFFSSNILDIYKTIRMHGVNFTSEYAKEVSTIDYFLEFRIEEIGAARFYFVIDGEIYVFFDIHSIADSTDHLVEIKAAETSKIMNIKEINTKLIYMKIRNREIVTKIPNRFEKT